MYRSIGSFLCAVKSWLRQWSLQISFSNLCVGIIVLLLAVLVLAPTRKMAAQDEDSAWSPPRNLSQSGAATDPQVVVDSGGNLHALWREDAINNFVYTRQNQEGEWTRPLPLELPFATRRWFDEDELREDDPTPLFDPYLVADGTGRIHAFWRNEDNVLYYSQVGANNVADFDSWTLPARVAEAATAVTAHADDNNLVHLAYVRPLDTADNPAGIYYQQALAESPTWSNPYLLEASTYFRAMPEEDANLQMQITASDGVWVAWENLGLEQIFLAGSLDQGQTWSPIQILDRREEIDIAQAQGPQNLRLVAAGDMLHAFWQAGHDSENCNQYHKYSPDGGISWTLNIHMEQFDSCADELLALGGADEMVYLLAATANETNLWAWNGTVWSLQQRQPIHIDNVIDPATYRSFAFEQMSGLLTPADQLVLFGNDEGKGVTNRIDEDEGKDVWLLERTLNDTESWFAPPSMWSEPQSITPITAATSKLHMFASPDALFHLFWEDSRLGEINYTRGVADQWLGVTPLTKDGLNFAVDLDSQVLFSGAWNTVDGKLLFSKIESDRVEAFSGWAATQEIPVSHLGLNKSALAVGADDQITLAYVSPVNEGRGVYMTSSQDGGEYWTEPIMVFDAVAADWPVVDNPRLAFTGANSMHLLWTRSDVLGEAAQELYYARSDDKGMSWSNPVPVETVATRDALILWSQVVGIGEQIVHRLWQTADENRVTVWHQLSTDAGITWSEAEAVVSDVVEMDDAGLVTVTADPYGRLFLLTTTPQMVRQHVWQLDHWQQDESLVFRDETAVAALTAAWSSNNTLGLLLAAKSVEDINADSELLFATGDVAEPTSKPIAIPTLTPTPEPTPTLTPTPLPQPTPTVVFPLDRSGDWQQSMGTTVINQTLLQVLAGIVPAILVVFFGFIVGITVVRRKRS